MSGARELETDALETEGADVGQADIETRARRMGWTPKEQFRGDPGRWIDAAKFVERGETEMPIMRARMITQDRVLERTTAELKDVRTLMEEMRERTVKAEERAYERARAAVKAEMDSAVQTADTAGYRAAEAKMAALDTDKPKPVEARPAAQQNPPPPEAVEWVSRQPWWNNNKAATAMAVQLHHQLTVDNPGMGINDNLAEVERRVRGAFPEAFPAAMRDAPAAVAGSAQGAPPRKVGKLTFDTMPAEERAEARKAFAKFKRQMPTFTEDEYLTLYHEA